jgi:DNA-binding cell septation regulator SpoVG
MNITRVDFYKDTTETNTIGTATVIFDYDFAIKDIKVMTGKKGEYLQFPTDKDGRYLAFPISEDSRTKILNAVLERMKEVE